MTSVTIVLFEKTFREPSPSFTHLFLQKSRKHKCYEKITTKHASNRPVMFVTHKWVLPSWVIYNVRVCFRRQNWKRVMTMVMVINRTTPGWPGGAVLSLQMTSSSSFPHRYDHSPTHPPPKGFSLRKWVKAPVGEVVHSPKKCLLPQAPLQYFVRFYQAVFSLFVFEFLHFVINHF